jgi:hypothetical protein
MPSKPAIVPPNAKYHWKIIKFLSFKIAPKQLLMEPEHWLLQKGAFIILKKFQEFVKLAKKKLLNGKNIYQIS